MVLDHLIVQKMDEDDSAGENVQSILTFGAKALFDEQEGNSHDITCMKSLYMQCLRWD